MSAGFLDKAGITDLKPTETDFSVANGVYQATINDSKIGEFNGKTKWQITYRIDPDTETYGGRTVSEWFDLDPDLPADRKQFLVRRLASLHINTEEQKTMEPEDILGTEVTITVKNKPSADGSRMFTNITRVVVGAEAHTTTSGKSFAVNF